MVEFFPKRSNREDLFKRNPTPTTAKTETILSSSWSADCMMESSVEASDERLGQPALTSFSNGDHGEEEEHGGVNDDENRFNNAYLAEGGSAGPEISDGTSSQSRSSGGTVGMKKLMGGKTQKSKTKRFVGVRQRPSGRWVAEIKDSTQNIRLWLGTYDNAEDAAAAYDEAARALRGSNTRTNFGLPKDGRSELPSKAIRLLLQRAKAASAAKTSPLNSNDANPADNRPATHEIYHQAAHQQVHPTPEEGQDSQVPNNCAVGYTLEADRTSSVLSHPLSLNAMNSFPGRGAQLRQLQQANTGSNSVRGRPSTSSAAELGTPDTEDKFTKAFIEMYTQLPSKRNAVAAEITYEGDDNRYHSGSSSARQTCSDATTNYNTGARGGLMNVATGPISARDLAMNAPRIVQPAFTYNVNSEQQQHNADRIRQLSALPLAELDVGLVTGFQGALPTVYCDLTKNLKDYLHSSRYSGRSSILWQQALSAANCLTPSSSGENPSVCPSFNASSFRQQEEARVNMVNRDASIRELECESTSSCLSSPGLFRSISDSLRSPGIPFPSTDFLPQEALWSQTQELSTVPVC